MSNYRGKGTGPWLWVSSKQHPPQRVRDLGGWPVRARMEFDHFTGLILNVGVAGWKSIVIGWHPNHIKPGCVAQPVNHRCWASKLPEWSLGKDPHELRMMV